MVVVSDVEQQGAVVTLNQMTSEQVGLICLIASMAGHRLDI